MDATLRPFSLLLREPLATASGPIERREGVLVHVESNGASGVGEATPLPGWTETYEACIDSLEASTANLDWDDPEAVLSALDETPAARHGLSLALADLEARQADRPLYRHLGAPERIESIPANATIGDGDAPETAAAAREATDSGFGCLKLKVGARPVREDVARLDAVRDAVGPAPTLRADANGAWTREQAREALDAFADHDVEYVEQPVDPLDLAGLADLRDGPVEVAVDETLARTDPSAVLEAGAADVLIAKPMVLGGLDRALDLLHQAAAAGCSVVVTTTIDAVVARTAAVHLATCLEDRPPAGLATAGWLAEDLADDPAPVVDGRAHVPQASGHGVRVEGWSP